MLYDIIVVGGGHAGCEAALSSARLNNNTLLITGNINNIADMPCNPSIGGSAKGIVVREIDALGGEMGRCADKSHIQIKLLNSSKGPAVRSLRAQADKITYPKTMQETLKNCKNLTIKEDIVEDLIIEDKKVCGVKLENGEEIKSKIVILTTGTYLKADILVGSERTRSGPNNQRPSNFLSDRLKDLGFNIQRLKTGTPPRLDRNSIDYEKAQREDGDNQELTFSFDNKIFYDVNKQVPCYLVYTNELTHQIIRDNLEKSAMYGGYATGIGPRYCPSIEDKVVRFSDKSRHQLFLEPESLFYDDIYLQGFSTSMPRDVQERMVHSIEGLENVKILKYAYAIEYDAIDPLQINYSLETKIIENLFTAGQINGTSGYEEAAAQGLIAGINASRKLQNKEPLILRRDEAYIGVLIDDLVTKGTKEPYRLLTSRAEFRLLLRHDNADLRLREYGHEIGLVDDKRYEQFLLKKQQINECIEILKNKEIGVTDKNNNYLQSKNSSKISDGITLYELLKRPEIKIEDLKFFIPLNFSDEILDITSTNIKYEGYINKEIKEAKKMREQDEKLIPEDIDYNNVKNLASEARQKLINVKPKSIGQASRISGVNPADISILLIYLKRRGKHE